MARQSDKLDVRVSRDLGIAIKNAAKARGYATPSAYIRATIEHTLDGREIDAITGAEERLVATIEQVRRELFRIGRAQQALFAFVDSLAKVLLTCIPEPPEGVREQAIDRAKARRSRLVKSAAAAMAGDSEAAVQDLVGYGQK